MSNGVVEYAGIRSVFGIRVTFGNLYGSVDLTDGEGIAAVTAGDAGEFFTILGSTIGGGVSSEKTTGDEILHILAINSGGRAVEIAVSDGEFDFSDAISIVGLGVAFVHSVFTRNGATRNGNIDRQLGGMLGNSNANAVGGGAIVFCLALKCAITSDGAVVHSQITSANFDASRTSDGASIFGKCSGGIASLINTVALDVNRCSIQD